LLFTWNAASVVEQMYVVCLPQSKVDLTRLSQQPRGPFIFHTFEIPNSNYPTDKPVLSSTIYLCNENEKRAITHD